MLLLKSVIFQLTLLRFLSTKLIIMRCSKQVRTSEIEEGVSKHKALCCPKWTSFMESLEATVPVERHVSEENFSGFST